MNRKIILTAIFAVIAVSLNAQPQRRLQEQAEAKGKSGVTLSTRAVTQYTAQTSTPTEISWKRDIYRELDLKKEANAALYYPEEPLGDRVNFFTLVFNLILEGKITAYEYRLDGNELFDRDSKLEIENLLDKLYIYFEKKDGKYVVHQADIPSSEVLKYYIKESNYLDQRGSNYQTRVTAVCPVWMRSDIGDAAVPYPMFWLNYEEISPYLAQTQVMTSSLNNTTNMSLDDYFVMRKYDGEIYKTSNLRNQPLAEYCDNDTLMRQEQQRIEKQLVDFESGLWSSAYLRDAEKDTTGVSGPSAKIRSVKAREGGISVRKEQTSVPAKDKPVKEKAIKAVKASKPSAGSQAGGRLSVHRGH